MLYTTYKNLKKPEETDIYKVSDFNENADAIDASLRSIETTLGTKAPLTSPALVGTPTAPTATAGTSTTQIATTKFVTDAANTKINVNGSNSSIDKLTFATSPSVDALASGQIRYNPAEETFDFAVNNQVYQLGQEISVLVRNDSGVAISDGQAVAITGSVGTQMTVQLASTGIAGIANLTLGVATQAIANGSTGKVTVLGLVRELNTNGLTQGAEIWLGATAGSITSVKPVSPAPKVLIGYVKKQHLTEGELFIRVQTGSTLDELDNVLITTVADGHSVFYESATQLWKNIAAYTKAQIDTLLGTKQNTLVAGHGDTLNPYASKTAKYFLAAPNGAAGVPSFRAIVASDIPTLNQNTTGSAATLTTGRTISLGGDVTGSVVFNGSENVTITAAVADDSHNHIIANVDGLQTALDAKQATITGGATTIATTNLTVSRALVSDASGKVAISATTAAQLGYLGDVTSLVQAQLNGKVNNAQVLTNVPAGAVFTDTVYTHPANHPASIITQDTSNRFVTDAEKADWNAKAPLASPALVTPTVSGSGRIISNDTETGTAVYEIWSGTQAQYDAIGTKDANTLYFIV